MSYNLFNRTPEIPQTKINKLDKYLNCLLFKYNDSGNFTPPYRPDIEGFTDFLNKKIFNYTGKIVRVNSHHLDSPYPHFITDIFINGKKKFSFDPNGTNNPDNTTMLNQINLHKANKLGQGECGLWCLAAMIEIIKEPNEQSLIANSESKELTKRIAARFINFKQFMSGEKELISLGEKIDSSVEKLPQDEQEFITPEGFTLLTDGKQQTLQIKSAPPTYPIKKISSTPSRKSKLSITGANIAFGRKLPQALESSGSDEQLTPIPQQSEQIKQPLKSNSQSVTNTWREKLNFSKENTQLPPQKPLKQIKKQRRNTM